MRVQLIRNAPDGRGGFIPRSIEGAIRKGITAHALAQAERWKRRLQEHHEEDESWDWKAFVSECRPTGPPSTARYLHYSLWVSRELQALMIVEGSGRRRLPKKALLPLVYVEYLSVAPENRPTVQKPRRVAGCGSAMLKYAVRLSFRNGWDGRVGLHSLPGAIAFYKNQGFRDLGSDDKEGFHYMELGSML